MQNIIKLRISGNPNSQGGFNALINKGVIPQGIIEEDRPFPISDNPGICLCHKDDQILYVLHDSKVVPSDAERDGRLTILMSIPKGFTIQNGTSPYEVLMEIYKFFVDNCMTPIEGSEVKRFKSMDAIFAQSEDCKAILNKYILEKGSLEFYNMADAGSTATLNVPASKLNEFFCDTQYPEFRKYKEIYITTQGNSSEALAGIKIPRDKEYEIWVNKRLQSKGPLLVTTTIKYSGGINTEDVVYDEVNTTLQELIEAEGNKLTFGQSTAELNLKTRRITLTIPPIYIYYKLEFKFDGDEDGIEKVKRNLMNGTNRITIAGMDYSKEYSNVNAKIPPSKTKEEARFTGLIDRYKITTRFDRNIVDKKAIITLKINKIITPPRPNPGPVPPTPPGPTPGPVPPTPQSPTPQPKRNNKLLYVSFIIGLIIGLIPSGLYIKKMSNKTSGDSVDSVEIYKEEVDRLKSEVSEQNDNIKKLKQENKALKDSIRNHVCQTKTPKPESKATVDPFIQNIENREDFAEFLKLVNKQDWEKIQKHEIYILLEKTKKYRKYANAIYNLNHTRMYLLNMTESKKNSEKVKTYMDNMPDMYDFKNLYDIEKENTDINTKITNL